MGTTNKKPGKTPIYGEPTRLLGKRVPVSKYDEILAIVQAMCEGKTVLIKSKTKPNKIEVNLGFEEFVTDKMNTLAGAIGVNAEELLKPMPKGCDCYLDQNGFLRRGKSGCKKAKGSHENLK